MEFYSFFGIMNIIGSDDMEDFKNLWEEVLAEVVLPKGYLDGIRETLDDSYLIAKAFQYCLIMRTKEGLQDFLDYHGSYEEFFKKKIIELLHLEKDSEEVQNQIISNFLRCNVIDNGFICHTTNNLSAENITQFGFNQNQTDAHTQGVLEELKQVFPAGVFKTDLNYILSQEERTGWFYDRTPYHFKRYANGPEWFKRLAGSGNFVRRDYKSARNFVANTMAYYEEPSPRIQKALALFDKYWNIYAPTTPHMILVSTRETELRPDREIDYVKNLTPEQQITYYTDTYFRITDNNTNKEIDPSQIIDIDMYELKRKMEEEIYKL